MPMSSKDMERIILADGWVFKNQVGSHRHYVHPNRKREVIHSFHFQDLDKENGAFHSQAGWA